MISPQRRKLIAKRKVAKRRLNESKGAVYHSQVPGMGGGHIIDKEPRVRGRRATIRYGVTLTAGKIYADPRYHLAGMIKSALTKPVRSSIVTVYDASGNPIATIDPHTRERKPIS